MTEPQQKSASDVQELARGLDGSNAQRAEAIALFVDGRLAVVMEALKDKVEGMVADHIETVKLANDLPPAQRAAVKESVNEAGQQLRNARAEVRSLADDELTDSGKVRQVAESAEKAGEAVSEAKSTVEEQLASLTSKVEHHGAILAPRKGSDHDNYLEDIEADVTGLCARVDQLEAGQEELRGVTATAFAKVQAIQQDSAWKRAGLYTLVAFVVMFVLYILFVLGPVNWDWNWAIGLPAVTAGIVAAITFVLTREEGPSAVATASAEAIVARWAENNRPAEEDVHMDEDHPVPGMGEQAHVR